MTESPPAEEVIAYEMLPAAAREAFDAERRGESVTLWTGEDDRAIEALVSHRYIMYEGEYYRYQVGHIDDPNLFESLARGLLTLVGGTLVTLGGLVLYTGRWRPLTPLRSLWLPLVALVAITATRTYDVVLSGAGGSPGLPNDLTTFFPVALLLLGVGSGIRRRGRSYLIPTVGAGVVVVVATAVGTVLTEAQLVVPVIIGGILIVLGLLVTLGYGLTHPE